VVNFLTSLVTLSFSRRTLLHGISQSLIFITIFMIVMPFEVLPPPSHFVTPYHE